MSEVELAAAVSRAVGVPVDRLVGTRREALDYDAFLANRTVSRLNGTAETPAGPRPWVLIEKVTEEPAVASAYLYDNGLREFHAYGSGLLESLAPGLSAPTAYGLHRSDDGRLTLWLEDLEADGRRMSRDEVLGAARDLGRFAGEWLGRAPSHPWLFTGWVERHGQPASVAPTLARLSALHSRAEIETRVGWGIDEAIELIEQQAAIAAVLVQMPQTLCHHDAVGANVFRRNGGGTDETVLIDWEMVGPGPIGADLASLVFSSARRGDLSAGDAVRLLPAALEAYAVGMDEARASVDAGTLLLAVNAAICLRWALARDIVIALEDSTRVRRGSAHGETAEEAMAELIMLSRLLLDSAAFVRRR